MIRVPSLRLLPRRPVVAALAWTILCVLVVPPIALAGASSSSQKPRSALTKLVCQRAMDPPDRYVSVTSVMRPVSGTKVLAVNFHLLQRTSSGSGWHSLQGPGLGKWITKDFGQQPDDVWRVVHPVSDLAAPASYRFVVDFRWTGAGGHVLKRASHASGVCRQPELRPDLQVLSVTVTEDPDKAKHDFYLAKIRDAGATGAGPFLVQLENRGKTVEHRVQHIDAHATKSVRLLGGLCKASDPPTVTADPNDQVDVYTRSQATLRVSCPSASSSSGTAGGRSLS